MEDDVNKSMPATTFVSNSASATFEPDDEPLVEPWKDEIEENILPFKFITYVFSQIFSFSFSFLLIE